MKKLVRTVVFSVAIASSLSLYSCRESNPGKDEEADMGMTSDSIFTETDTINNNVSTEGADTEMDGE